MTSNDDGVTWGNYREVYRPLGNKGWARQPQVANVGGKFVLTFVTNDQWSDTAASGMSNQNGLLKMLVSNDGVSWRPANVNFAGVTGAMGPEMDEPGLCPTNDGDTFFLLGVKDGTLTSEKWHMGAENQTHDWGSSGCESRLDNFGPGPSTGGHPWIGTNMDSGLHRDNSTSPERNSNNPWRHPGAPDSDHKWPSSLQEKKGEGSVGEDLEGWLSMCAHHVRVSTKSKHLPVLLIKGGIHVEQGTPERFPTGLWNPFLRLSNNGTVQLFYSGKNNASDQGINLRWSSDLGTSWSPPSIVSGTSTTLDDSPNVSPGMPDTKELMCTFSGTNKTTPNVTTIYHTTSYDDGFTWQSRDGFYSSNVSAGTPQIINTGKTVIFTLMANDVIPDFDAGLGAEGAALRMFLSPIQGVVERMFGQRGLNTIELDWYWAASYQAFHSNFSPFDGATISTIYHISSNDDGLTWSSRQELYARLRDHANATVPRIINMNGTLIFTLKTNDEPRYSDNELADRGVVKMLFSKDGTHWDPISIMEGTTMSGPYMRLPFLQYVNEIGELLMVTSNNQAELWGRGSYGFLYASKASLNWN
ncbi:hypothetical protein B0T16DRAFT_392957 [Cercophora newfieldiana]|uniref:Sialidase domain-containing protein n=1 Tax=Cercophora newfieldiana TaxID=92897 RepID=A0AA40CPM3_9PEZI|nr:hypothetical protein B0T16DRAFT_392957 [Cercophora newfieldiana]